MKILGAVALILVVIGVLTNAFLLVTWAFELVIFGAIILALVGAVIGVLKR
jgi:hypothetical protein